jgi:hypothetical protein
LAKAKPIYPKGYTDFDSMLAFPSSASSQVAQDRSMFCGWEIEKSIGYATISYHKLRLVYVGIALEIVRIFRKSGHRGTEFLQWELAV